jgi:hypothetical protein
LKSLKTEALLTIAAIATIAKAIEVVTVTIILLPLNLLSFLCFHFRPRSALCFSFDTAKVGCFIGFGAKYMFKSMDLWLFVDLRQEKSSFC